MVFRCANGRQVTVEKVNSTIFVYDSEKSLTSLDAQQLVETDEQNLIHGEKVFHDLRIMTHAATDRINVKDPKLTVTKFLLYFEILELTGINWFCSHCYCCPFVVDLVLAIFDACDGGWVLQSCCYC